MNLTVANLVLSFPLDLFTGVEKLSGAADSDDKVGEDVNGL